MRQINSRCVDRGAQRYVAISLDDEGFTVTLEQPEGNVERTLFVGSDAEQAFDVYDHPFVNPKIEDPWKRVSESVEEYESVPV